MSINGRIAVVAAFGALVVQAVPLELHLGLNGTVDVDGAGIKFAPLIYGEGWNKTASAVSRDFVFPDEGGVVRYDLCQGGDKWAKGLTQLWRERSGARLFVDVESLADRRPEDVVLALELPFDSVCGGSWRIDESRSGVFAPEWDGRTVAMFAGKVSKCAIRPKNGNAFTLEFDQPTDILLQDNRRWGKSFTLRVRSPRAGKFALGDRRAFSCLVSSDAEVKVDVARPVVVKAGDEWTALDYRKDIIAGSALDFSAMGLQDAPAGRHGWLKNVGGHFEFERSPGVVRRFYGINLCFGANYPDHALADRLTTRLVRLGYNTVRVHHYERDLVRGAKDRMAFSADRLDRMDYLLAKCREKGLYITTDLFVSRPVAWRDIGIDRDGEIPMQMLKGFFVLHERAFENWKEFSRRLLNHVNPYTGLAYVNDPALPLLSMINEGTLMWHWRELRNEECLKLAWRDWLRSERRSRPRFAERLSETEPPENAYATPEVKDFAAAMERRFMRRARKFLKDELGVRAMLTNQNCSGEYAQMMAVRRDEYDYVDNHFYVDHPHFLAQRWRLPSSCGNGNPVKAKTPAPTACARTRVEGKPFTVTEWNFSGPGMYRGVGGIMTGALAAQQQWDGLWRFAYSHSEDNLHDRKGFPGYFDVSTDPLGQAGDRASVCLFLRGDLSRESELKLDRERGTLAIDTPRTAGGFTPGGRLEAGALAFDCGAEPSTVWVSSLDGRPIASSERMLVTHLTDVQGNGNVYAEKAKKILLKWGSYPPVVRNGQARLELACARPERMSVWALATTGERVERVPCEVRGGRLVFTASVKGAEGARMLYEISAGK